MHDRAEMVRHATILLTLAFSRLFHRCPFATVDRTDQTATSAWHVLFTTLRLTSGKDRLVRFGHVLPPRID
jgi:hypothetical protein